MSTASPLSRKDRLLQRILPRVRPAILGQALKRWLGVRRVEVATPHGRFRIDPVSTLGLALTRGGAYEPGMVETLARCLSPGCVFLDLGANEGFFTVLGAGLVGAAGRVIAVEPQARLLPVLRDNCALNGVLDRVTVVEDAVSDRSGPAHLFLAPDLNPGSSGLARATRYALPTQDVSVTTLAGLLDRLALPRIDLVKIDIEGHEYEAILGSPEVFRGRRVQAVALELHPGRLRARGRDPRAITDFLAGCGYRRAEELPTLVYVAP